MQDDLRIQNLTDCCRASQEVFNALAAIHHQHCDAVGKAVAERNQIARALAEQVNEIGRHARALRDLGAPVPVAIKDGDFYRAFGRGMELGQIHAELEEIAAAQRIRAMPLPKAA